MPIPQGPSAPQTMPTAPASGALPGGGPAFVGTIDTPPLQNAPPLFDQADPFGGMNPWDALGLTQEQYNLGPSYWNAANASFGSQLGLPNAPAQRPGGNYPFPKTGVGQNGPTDNGQLA
jgi:hypothetical protein